MNINKNVSLRLYNTFGVDEVASAFGIVHTIDDIRVALSFDSNPLILGSGSNILFTQSVNRLVIKNELNGLKVLSESDDYVFVQIASGENWHDTVVRTVNNGWSGLENLSLIPGTVGAAPVQNIGAYGVELRDVLVSVEVMDMHTGEIICFTHSDCAFGYRDSIFKNEKNKHRFFILSIDLKLSKAWQPNTSYGEISKKLIERNILVPTLKDMHETIIAIRSEKLPDPWKIGNAGSFFKNPVINKSGFEQLLKINPNALHYKVGDDAYKIPAGWLIDQCGWKGKRIGDVGCYEKQALVIVNHGNASGADIWNFAMHVQKDVFDTFGIRIDPEINII